MDLIISEIVNRGLADEYDAAQERGEVGQQTGRPKVVTEQNDFSPPTAADVGLSRKQIHQARQVRDAEKADPGIVKRTLKARVDAGQEPTKAPLRETSPSGNPPEYRGKISESTACDQSSESATARSSAVETFDASQPFEEMPPPLFALSGQRHRASYFAIRKQRYYDIRAVQADFRNLAQKCRANTDRLREYLTPAFSVRILAVVGAVPISGVPATGAALSSMERPYPAG